jgi:hypothetical protein
MTRKFTVPVAIFGLVLFCGLTLAQDPVMDIDRTRHANLAEAQRHVVEANKYVIAAQKDNAMDMAGHAEKARELLVQVNQELKLAAEAANAANGKRK